MAAARKSAEATRASAVFATPLKARPSPALVPSRAAGLAGLGDSPSKNVINAAMTTAETAYSRASVIQTMTAKARIASIRCPAFERPSGVGNKMTVTSAATASRTPQFDRNQPGLAAGGTLAPAEPGSVSTVTTKKFLPAATISFRPLGFASLVLARDRENVDAPR